MRMIRTRTKIEALLAVSMIIILSYTSVFAVTRTITSTGDSFDTYIRNSNGNYWTVSEANLQLAINNLGTGSGWKNGIVWVPGNVTVTINTGLVLKDNIILDLQGSYLDVRSNVDGVTMAEGSTLCGGTIDTRNYVGTYTKAAVVFKDQDYTTGQTRVQNMYLQGAENEGSGIEYRLDTQLDISSFTSCNDVQIYHFKYGILMNVSGGVNTTITYANGNTFNDITMIHPMYALYLTRKTTVTHGYCDVDGNVFDNIIIQTGSNTMRAIYAEGRYNIFDNIFVWDWSVAAGAYAYEFPSDSTYQSLRFYGTDSFSDSGTRNNINGVNKNVYEKQPYSIIVFRNATRIFAMEGDTGNIVKQSNDASTVFIYCVSYAGSSYRNIFIRRGAYNLTAAINGDYASGTTWIGESRNNTILRIATGYSGNIFDFPGKNNVTIRDLTLDGNPSGATSHTRGIQLGFTASSVRDILIENCVFKGFSKTTSSGGFVYETPTSVNAYNIKIINSEFYNNYRAIRIYGDADPSYIYYSDISHNFFRNNNYSIMLSYVRNSTISNNIGAVGVNGIYEDAGCDYNIITGNNFLGCSAPLTSTEINSVNGMQLPLTAPVSPVNGSIWFITGNETIAVYWDGLAYYFQNDGSFTLP